MKRFIAIFLALSMLASMAVAVTSDGEFSEDITDKLICEGAAEYEGFDSKGNNVLFLTGSNINRWWGRGVYQQELPEDFMLEFDFDVYGHAGGSKYSEGGSGITVAFFADKMPKSTYYDETVFDGCGGYGLEIDARNFDEDGKTYHAAIVEGTKANHIAKVDLPYEKVRDPINHTHSVKLIVSGNNITVFYDGKKIISKTVNMDKTNRTLCIGAYNVARGLEEYQKVSNVVLSSVPAYADASEWAKPELDRAEELGLIPEMLVGIDMTRKITRLEFAALAVQLVEAITNKTAEVVDTPFNDVKDDAVAKAYGLGITGGVAADLFAPDQVIPREQVATMLTRALKAALPELEISNSGAQKFADDAEISDWARESVYYMASKGIINGVGNNEFAPKNMTAAEIAAGYANSSVEQAVIISARAFEKK